MSELLDYLREGASDVDWTRSEKPTDREFFTIDTDWDLYWAFCQAIERHGIPVAAEEHDFLYLELDGWHYWWTQKRINRAPVVGNDDAQWGWDPIGDPTHDHLPADPRQVTRVTWLIQSNDDIPNQ